MDFDVFDTKSYFNCQETIIFGVAWFLTDRSLPNLTKTNVSDIDTSCEYSIIEQPYQKIMYIMKINFLLTLRQTSNYFQPRRAYISKRSLLISSSLPEVYRGNWKTSMTELFVKNILRVERFSLSAIQIFMMAKNSH